MRHNRTHKKLGRTSAHRQALFRNQMASLISHGRIITTLAKAKAVRPLAERLVTQGKRNTVHARRLVGRYVADRDLIQKLFDTIAPRFAERSGGYLRIVRLGPRYGDGGERAVLEFVDYERPVKAEEPAPAKPAK
jgi:large subunit ribosomal protein L17